MLKTKKVHLFPFWLIRYFGCHHLKLIYSLTFEFHLIRKEKKLKIISKEKHEPCKIYG